MDIYFCLSYLSVPHTITLIRNKYATDFLIITSNKQLYKFFTELYNKDNIKLIPSFSYTIPFTKGIVLLPIKLIWIWRMKHKMWNTFKGIENQNVYFFFNASAYSHAWIIYKLSKRNTIFYQEDINLSSFPVKRGFIPWISKSFIRYVYKEEVYPIDQGGGFVAYKMQNEYLEKVKAQPLNIQLNYRDISSWVSHLMKLPKGDILILNGLMPERGVSIENHVKTSDTLIERLNFYGYNVHFKLHSRGSTKYSLEKTLFEVPKYLPASLLLNYKAFIGYISSSLTEAANNDLIAISLIDCIPTYNEEKKNQMKIYLKKNLLKGKVIYFPRSVNDVLDILKE